MISLHKKIGSQFSNDQHSAIRIKCKLLPHNGNPCPIQHLLHLRTQVAAYFANFFMLFPINLTYRHISQSKRPISKYIFRCILQPPPPPKKKIVHVQEPVDWLIGILSLGIPRCVCNNEVK